MGGAREQEIRVPVGSRELEVYRVDPEGPPRPRPTVVVIHEIFGADAHVRDVARRFAKEGYVAVAPNLFPPDLMAVLTPANIAEAMKAFATAPPGLRQNPSLYAEFAAAQPPERRPVLAAMGQVSTPQTQAGYAVDLARLADHLRRTPGVAPDRIGSVGFCFGGAMSGRFATQDPKLRAAVIFYGQNPPLADLPALRAAVLGLYGGEDVGITSTVPALAEAMKAAGKSFSYHVYPGAKHAFFNDTRPTYDAAAASDAWTRVLGFFRAELGP